MRGESIATPRANCSAMYPTRAELKSSARFLWPCGDWPEIRDESSLNPRSIRP